MLLTVLSASPALASSDHAEESARVQRLLSGLSGDFKVAALAGAIALAFMWGAGHALSPGHGKALVGAYLIQSRGRYIDAVGLGVVVTLAHTFSVIVLGLSFAWVLHGERGREHVLLCLELASAALVVCFGAWLLISRTLCLACECSEAPEGHEHDRQFAHDHLHDPIDTGSHLAGGGPRAGGHAHHAHGVLHHRHPYAEETQVERFVAGYRSPQSRVRLGELVALGISGGIVPCPSALVIVLLGLHFRTPWTALLLVAAFSLGLASVLILIGCVLVSGSGLARRWPRATAWMRAAPIFSAVAILIIGLGLAGTAMARHGLLTLNEHHRHPPASGVTH